MLFLCFQCILRVQMMKDLDLILIFVVNSLRNGIRDGLKIERQMEVIKILWIFRGGTRNGFVLGFNDESHLNIALKLTLTDFQGTIGLKSISS